ncbi:hypothetical protein [Kocuria atrinae]|uniref:hypothetical protein n=1 Tax=Kocuria atrinae TaxID=592377 RepID=UPI001CB940D0|nr:hypothetical protein [Kocuria atrinae]
MLLTCLVIALLTCFASPLITKFLGRNAGWVLALPLLGAAALAVSAFADAARSGSVDGSGSPVVEQWVPWMPLWTWGWVSAWTAWRWCSRCWCWSSAR